MHTDLFEKIFMGRLVAKVLLIRGKNNDTYSSSVYCGPPLSVSRALPRQVTKLSAYQTRWIHIVDQMVFKRKQTEGERNSGQ